MDSVILSRSRKYGRNIIADSDFAKLVKLPEDLQAPTPDCTYHPPYFFFASELSVPAVPYPRNAENIATYAELKKTQIRHCIPNRKNYVDYVSGKKYNTLEEWAVDNGKTLADVLYGINYVHFIDHQRAYGSVVYHMPLDVLVDHIMPHKKVVNTDPAIVLIDKDRMNRLIGMMEQATAELKEFI
jgi:hypothetical protein